MTATEKHTEPKSVWELIDKIGGRRLALHLTERLGRDVAFSTVHSWKERGKIPAEHWLEIIGLCATLEIPGVTPAVLTLWHATKTEGPTG